MPAPSFWWTQAPPRPPRPALVGERSADVCIVGAGLTGLWTAYELRRAAPELEVVVVEARHAGFGASGRNGGWVLGELAGHWERSPGGAELLRAVRAAVAEVGAALAREGIDCDWRHDGAVTVAQTAAQAARLRPDEAHRRLEADELGARIAVAGAHAALYTPHCARVHPARMVGGLAAAVERRGARIFEESRVRRIAPGLVVGEGGRVRARHVIRATEGYSADLPGERRSLLPLGSSMIVTEQVGDIGWPGGETLHDAAHRHVYLQRTADGRVAIGGRGVPYRFGSRTEREGPVPPATVAELSERLVMLFPALRGVAIEGAWHGVLGVARDWRPRVDLDPRTGLGWAGGYAGQGVAAAHLAARTLVDLVLGRESELTRLPWVGPGARRWEPEPLRFAGARGVYALYRLADRREARTGRPSAYAAVADRVAGRT